MATTQTFDDRDPVEALAEEFLLRRRNGEQPTVREYVDAYPSLAEGIRTHFPTVLMLEHFKSCSLSSPDPRPRIPAQPPSRLGDFRLVDEIGRGGMATVYEAEQESLQRRVAVKVFPENTLLDSHELHRFHREARTAARLHHTNIVPVFGVGQQDGWHYFVMQRIRGVALDVMIQQTAADPSSRRSEQRSDARRDERSVDPFLSKEEWNWVARIGIQVADAVAYAHGQGVLHRDIKPGNLLLDEHGVVWVTDFGLATLMQADEVGDRGKIIGTIRFMAPEQVRGEADARSDVYSLGLTLYELLTRQPAFEARTRSRLLDKIHRGDFSPPRAVRPAIPRDLEALILKAIACDPDHRYQSAQEFAEDLRRFVGGRPVKARCPGVVERIHRWSQRSPAIAMLAAALLLVAGGSFALISVKWREAVAENQRAEKNLSLALESMDHILSRFTSSWMADPNPIGTSSGETLDADIGYQMVVSDHHATLLKDALNFYAEFAKQNPTDPRLQRDTAKVHHRVGEIYSRLGQFENAQRAHEHALMILERQVNREAPAIARERASALNQLGLAYHAQSQFQEAEMQFDRARMILSADALAEDPQCQCELAKTFTNLGHAQWLAARRDEATENHRRSITLLESVVETHPENVHYRLALARAYRAFHPLLAFGKTRGDAERIRVSGVTILESLVVDHPGVPDFRCELSEMLTVTSYRRGWSRDADLERDRLSRAVQIARSLTEAYPSVPRYRAVLANALKESARLTGRDRQRQAEALSLESVSLYRTLVRQFDEVPAYRLLLAMALQDHAERLRRLGRYEESTQMLEEAVNEQRVYVRLRPQNRFGRGVLTRLEANQMRAKSRLRESSSVPHSSDSHNRKQDDLVGDG